MDGDEQDTLRSIRNAFYLGQLENTFDEAKVLKKDHPNLSEWADIFCYRALTAAGQYSKVFSGISNTASTALQAVKQLASFMQAANDEEKELVLETIKGWTDDDEMGNDVTLQLIAATIYTKMEDYKSAMALISNAGDNLEKLALAVQIYLKMDRLDLAESSAQQMQSVDDDDTLTVLASSWIHISMGGERLTEALFTLQDLNEKFGGSVVAYNGMATCQLHQGNWVQAFQYLNKAKELNDGKATEEVLVNTIVCLQHAHKKQDTINNYIKELEENFPNSPWLLRYKAMEERFEMQKKSYDA